MISKKTPSELEKQILKLVAEKELLRHVLKDCVSAMNDEGMLDQWALENLAKIGEFEIEDEEMGPE